MRSQRVGWFPLHLQSTVLRARMEKPINPFIIGADQLWAADRVFAECRSWRIYISCIHTHLGCLSPFYVLPFHTPVCSMLLCCFPTPFSLTVFYLTVLALPHPSCWGSWRKYVPWPSSSLPIISLALRGIEGWDKRSRTWSLCCPWSLPFFQNLLCCRLLLSHSAANFHSPVSHSYFTLPLVHPLLRLNSSIWPDK